MENLERVHVLYSGTVQGVGFRYAAERLARKIGITGFVKNLSGGDVEIISEGSRRDLESFLDELQKMMYGYISDSRITWEPAQGDFRSFDIRF